MKGFREHEPNLLCPIATPAQKSEVSLSQLISLPFPPFSCLLPSVHMATKYLFYHVLSSIKEKQTGEQNLCYSNIRKIFRRHQAGNNRWKPQSLMELLLEKTSSTALIAYQLDSVENCAGKFPAHDSLESFSIYLICSEIYLKIFWGAPG